MWPKVFWWNVARLKAAELEAIITCDSVSDIYTTNVNLLSDVNQPLMPVAGLMPCLLGYE